MATTLMPLDPALSPQQMNRVLTISADLLPEEIVAGRRGRRTRGWVLTALLVVLAALGGWYADAGHDTAVADRDLAKVNDRAIALQHEQREHARVVNVQTETTAITGRLKKLLADDLPWATLLGTLRTTGADSGVVVQGISAMLQAKAEGASTAATLPSTGGAATVGTVTVTGTGPDKPSIARYVEALAKLKTVASPYLTTAVQNDDGSVGFTLTVEITEQALCGRFTTACSTTGGK